MTAYHSLAFGHQSNPLCPHEGPLELFDVEDTQMTKKTDFRRHSLSLFVFHA